MIDVEKIKMAKENDVVYYVEYAGMGDDGKPTYAAHSAWYLRSYISRLATDNLMHIVTMNDSIETTVVRHVPSSRLFMSLPEANEFITKLMRGEAVYER